MNQDFEKDVFRCHWLFKWNFQGLLLKLRFLKLKKLSESETDDDSSALELAHEKYSAAQFACKYGRVEKPYFREFIKDVEQQKIASRFELRTLIEGGDLRQKNKDKIKLKLPLFSAIGGVLFIFLSFISIILLSLLVTLSPISYPVKVLLLFVVNGIIFGCAYVFSRYTLFPYRIARKLKPTLEKFISKRKTENKSTLRGIP